MLTSNENKNKETVILSEKCSGKLDVKMNGKSFEKEQLSRYLAVHIDPKLSILTHFLFNYSSFSFLFHFTIFERVCPGFVLRITGWEKISVKIKYWKYITLTWNAFYRTSERGFGLCVNKHLDTIETIELKTKPFLKVICFKKKWEIEEIGQKPKIYFVKELHIYESLKLPF